MKKIAIIGGGVVAALLLVIVVGGFLALKVLVNEEFLVTQIESNLNVRAEIKKLNISLFSAMSSVEVEGVSLGARDNDANQATPLAQRKPMQNAVLSVKSVDLKLSLLPLLARRFELKRFLLSEPSVSMVIYENGTNSLTPLFKKPLIVAGKPNPALTEKAEPAEEASEEKDKPFTAKDLPISATLKEIGMRGGNVTLLLQKTGQTIKVTGLSLMLDSIDIDPADLVKHNSIRISMDANAQILSSKKTDAAGLFLRSGGTVQPFDPKTGEVTTGVDYLVTVKKDSYISGMAAFDQLAGELPVLNKVGFSWKKLADKALLLRDVDVKVRYSKGLVTFLEDAAFPTANYDLVLKKGSTMNTANGTHNFNAAVRASEAESSEILARFDRGIEKKLKGAMTVDQARGRILGALLQQGKVELPFASLGSFENPDVKLLAELPSITEILTGGATDALRNKLNERIPGGGDLLKKLPF